MVDETEENIERKKMKGGTLKVTRDSNQENKIPNLLKLRTTTAVGGEDIEQIVQYVETETAKRSKLEEGLTDI